MNDYYIIVIKFELILVLLYSIPVESKTALVHHCMESTELPHTKKEE
jgi:hypothetical protein